MDQGIPHAAAGQLKPVICPNDLATRREHDFDEILKSATEHFDVRSIPSTTDQGPALPGQGCAVTAHQAVAVGFTHRHIKQAIWTEAQAMQTAVVCMAEVSENGSTIVRPSVAIGIFERHQLRRI